MEEKKEWTPMVESCEPIEYLEWTQEYEDMIAYETCPNCDWEPDSDDWVISYGPQIYDSWASRESSFPQYYCARLFECPECSTKFKVILD